MVAAQQVLGLLTERRLGVFVVLFVIGLKQAPKQVDGQVGDVLAALIEGGNLDNQLGEAVIKIFTENAIGNQLPQITIGAGDQQHLRVAGDVFAETNKFAVVKKTQQLDLGFGISVTNLIKKNHPAMGFLKDTAPVVMGSGKSPTFVTKQL